MGDFTFKGFQHKDVAKMRKTFNSAFKDYLIPINLSQGQFVQKILQKTNISFKYSVGAYYNKKLIGFLYNSINIYEGKKTAYNGGTGVIEDFRGNHLTERMYRSILPDLVNIGVEQCVLEVITNNKAAIKVYENLGFKRSKFFHCMKLKEQGSYLDKIKKKDIVIRIPEKPKWKKYEQFCDYSPSFLDTFPLLKRNKQNETILEAYKLDQLVGFMIFNRRMGRVEQIAVDPAGRGNQIGSMLVKKMKKICRKKSIYILNLNERNYDLLNFFLRLGFCNEIDQFELQLLI